MGPRRGAEEKGGEKETVGKSPFRPEAKHHLLREALLEALLENPSSTRRSSSEHASLYPCSSLHQCAYVNACFWSVPTNSD